MSERHIPEVGDALDLPHATGTGRLVLSRGNLFAVVTSRGDIAPAGARELGVFHKDTRHLSAYEMRLPGNTTLLSSGTEGNVMAQIDLTTTDEEFGGLLDEPIQFLHVQRRQVLDEVFTEHVLFTNHLGRAVEFDVDWAFAADWADVFEVRGARRVARGVGLPPRVGADRCELRYRAVTDEVLHTLVRFDPPPAELQGGRARVRVRLEPGETFDQHVTVSCGAGDVDAHALRPFPDRVARARREADEFRHASARVRCDNAIVQRSFERALSDVYALRILHEGRWIVGAGIPWFAAPFGRDSLIASLQLLPIAPQLAVETLRFLAFHQGKTHDLSREEEPGKICHELRRGEMARAREIPHSPYYGSVDSTPLFVMLAAEYWRWTRDEALLRELWPHVQAAVEWIEGKTANGTAFLTYQRQIPLGLENQGWKDSRDGVSFPDGRRAEAPIALVEVQGYAAAAWLAGAEVARAMGDPHRAALWASRVEPFVRRVDEAFWATDTSFYGLAVDGRGRLLPTVTSNPGHLLWCRAVPESRARRVVEVLTTPEMDSGWGIRTVARGQTVYNPLSYHNGSVWPHDNAILALGMARYGFGRAAVRIMENILASSEHFPDHRLPELFCGLPRGNGEFLVHYPVSCSPQAWASGAMFMLAQASLGLEADAPAGRLRIRNPALPATLRRFELHGMRVGESTVSLRFARSGKRTHADVLDIRGGPLRIDIEVE